MDQISLISVNMPQNTQFYNFQDFQRFSNFNLNKFNQNLGSIRVSSDGFHCRHLRRSTSQRITAPHIKPRRRQVRRSLSDNIPSLYVIWRPKCCDMLSFSEQVRSVISRTVIGKVRTDNRDKSDYIIIIGKSRTVCIIVFKKVYLYPLVLEISVAVTTG